MPNIDLTNPVFTDEDKARAHLERERWPDGVTCPFCGSLDAISPLKGASMGAGWYHCNSCRDKFTVRVGSVMERSHIPLTKWALAFHLMCASKKGVSAKQIQRMLGLKSYKSAWFMCHRIREAMKPDAKSGPLGGPGKVLESDETFVGGKGQERTQEQAHSSDATRACPCRARRGSARFPCARRDRQKRSALRWKRLRTAARRSTPMTA
jgi:transposase-like protein